MSLNALEDVISRITPAGEPAMAESRTRWSRVAKPLGSLGLLEDAIVRAAGAMDSADVYWATKAVAVFCADNGVAAEGLSQAGPEVTAAVAGAMARGEACVCRMAWNAGAEVFPVDIGLAQPIEEDGILRRHVLRGTRSIAQGPAMTRSDALAAIMTGVWLAEELTHRGPTLLAAGEMGVGNAVTVQAVAAVLLQLPVEQAAGPDTDGAAYSRRIRIIQQAIQMNTPNPDDPVEVLAKVGGLDIAAMAGFFLGAALHGAPVVLDGAVSCAAALAAVRLCPNAAKVLIASHLPGEPCGRLLLEHLGLRPFIQAGLYLGEGSGAVAAMPMLDMALNLYRNMSSFEELGISPY